MIVSSGKYRQNLESPSWAGKRLILKIHERWGGNRVVSWSQMKWNVEATQRQAKYCMSLYSNFTLKAHARFRFSTVGTEWENRERNIARK
jgi:hypothetical protein